MATAMPDSPMLEMIPEGLYLLVSVTLAVGAGKLAIKKVMLHDMKSIETLARVDTLCIDKTGTITENKMSVKCARIYSHFCWHCFQL